MLSKLTNRIRRFVVPFLNDGERFVHRPKFLPRRITGDSHMKIAKTIGVILGCLLTLLIILAPIGPVPGFFIGGTATEVPATWPDTSGVDEIELQVPGTPPRAVIIWVIDFEAELYIVGRSESTWVNMIGQTAPVKMRLGENTYSLTASLVQTGWEPMMKAYVDKYEPDYPGIIAGLPAVGEAMGKIAVFKLSR